MSTLEQMLSSVSNIAQDGMYQTIDTYTSKTIGLYSFDPEKPPNPIGSMGSGFQKGSQGNIRRNLGNNLQERYDFSGHNGTEPHLNYDLMGAGKRFNEKALGDTHKVDLFKK